MFLRVTNTTRGRILAERAHEASSFVQRFLGLMGRRSLPVGEGLLIAPCDGIHMFFMRFPIDAVFLDGEGVVVRVYDALAPWRVTAIVQGARSVLELPAGVVTASGTQVGDRLAFERPADGPRRTGGRR